MELLQRQQVVGTGKQVGEEVSKIRLVGHAAQVKSQCCTGFNDVQVRPGKQVMGLQHKQNRWKQLGEEVGGHGT